MKTVNMISKWVPRLSINYSIMISYIHKQLKKYILYVNKKIKTTKRRGEETKNSWKAYSIFLKHANPISENQKIKYAPSYTLCNIFNRYHGNHLNLISIVSNVDHNLPMDFYSSPVSIHHLRNLLMSNSPRHQNYD